MLATKETLEVMNRMLRDYDHGNLNKMLKDYESGNLVSVVKCKDCKHWHNSPVSDGYNSCERDALIRGADFFCADGEKVMTNEKENISRDGSSFLHNCFSD